MRIVPFAPTILHAYISAEEQQQIRDQHPCGVWLTDTATQVIMDYRVESGCPWHLLTFVKDNPHEIP